MEYDYYYDDRYDAPDFMDEESIVWWDHLAESVIDWMNTDKELFEDDRYEDGYPVELVNDYMDKFIDIHPDLVCELYDRWLNRYNDRFND